MAGSKSLVTDPGPRWRIRRNIHASGSVHRYSRSPDPRSPWQNAYAERLIGSIRRECVDHIVVFGERHLRHVLLSYMSYYNGTRTHLSLNKDAPMLRGADSDQFARLFRSHLAQDSEMISPRVPISNRPGTRFFQQVSFWHR